MIPKQIMEKIESTGEKTSRVDVRVGNAVKVHVKVREGGKERIQMFSGMIIARRGTGTTETFTVRRTSHGVGVERIFPVNSPSIARIEIEKSSHVRRAKLFYLRGRTGKQSRLREEDEQAPAAQ